MVVIIIIINVPIKIQTGGYISACAKIYMYKITNYTRRAPIGQYPCLDHESIQTWKTITGICISLINQRSLPPSPNPT